MSLSLGLLVLFVANMAVAAPEQGQQQEGLIKAVQQAPKSLTLTDSTGKNEQTYSVPLTCEITVDGQKATFTALKPGYFVKVILNDQKQATTISASTKQQQ